MTRSFTSAATLDEAVAALGSGARPVAGGTDLVVGARQGKAPLPDAIVAIDRIESLTHLDDTGGGLRLGALVTHEAIVASEAAVFDHVQAVVQTVCQRCIEPLREARSARMARRLMRGAGALYWQNRMAHAVRSASRIREHSSPRSSSLSTTSAS